MTPSTPCTCKPSKTSRSSSLQKKEICQNFDNLDLSRQLGKSSPSLTMMSSALRDGLKKLLRVFEIEESWACRDRQQCLEITSLIETYLSGGYYTPSINGSLLDLLEDNLELFQIVAQFRQQAILKFKQITREKLTTSKRVTCQSREKKQSESAGLTRHTRRHQNGAK